MKFILPIIYEAEFTSALNKCILETGVSNAGLIELSIDKEAGSVTVILEQQFADKLSPQQVNELNNIATQ